jgi:hypothetical protein
VEFSILKPDISILHRALLLHNAIEYTKVIKTLSEPPRQPTSANPNARSVTRNRGGETFYSRDGERGHCMTGLGQLDYVPSGDAALTRRARIHSPLSAVVVRFSRARKRYERQGIFGF